MVAAARAWGKLAVVACGTMCQSPKTRTRFRKSWGCDRPTTRPVAAIPCYECLGAAKDKACACKGNGSIRLTRCPTSLVDADIAQMYRAYHWYRKGILPVAGGFLNQTAQFVQCVPFLDSVWEHYLAEARASE